MHAGVARRDARHEVQAVGAEGGGRGGAQLGFGSRAEGARDRTGPADMARQAPGVDPGQRRNAVAAQEGLEGLGGPPVRRLVGQVADHDPPAVRGEGLVVGDVRAVVPDVGAGEGDHLARVGRVRDHLLVAAHGGVEHELARGHGQRGAGRLAGEHAAVRRHQQRGRPVAVAGQRCVASALTVAPSRRSRPPHPAAPCDGLLRRTCGRHTACCGCGWPTPPGPPRSSPPDRRRTGSPSPRPRPARPARCARPGAGPSPSAWR